MEREASPFLCYVLLSIFFISLTTSLYITCNLMNSPQQEQKVYSFILFFVFHVNNLLLFTLIPTIRRILFYLVTHILKPRISNLDKYKGTAQKDYKYVEFSSILLSKWNKVY